MGLCLLLKLLVSMSLISVAVYRDGDLDIVQLDILTNKIAVLETVNSTSVIFRRYLSASYHSWLVTGEINGNTLVDILAPLGNTLVGVYTNIGGFNFQLKSNISNANLILSSSPVSLIDVSLWSMLILLQKFDPTDPMRR